MKARMKRYGHGWRTVELSVSAGRREGHYRAIITVNENGGTRHTLELNRRDAFKLADAIVDALETGKDAT